MTSQLLYDTLDDLLKDDLKRFKSFLQQDGHIKAGPLENADVTDIVDMMVMDNYYGPKEAGRITVNILRKINQNQLALDLENKYAEVLKSLEEVEKHTRKQEDVWLQELLKTHKKNMKEKVENIFDIKMKKEVCLADYYTELFITEGDIKEVNQEHEILKIDVAFKPCKSQDRAIKCNDVFSLNKNKKKIVLTKGIAGIGKTISAHKFILDWIEGKVNQDVHFVFLLPLRKMNCIKDKEISLHKILQTFNPELKDLETWKIDKIYGCKLAIIFDGLDESRLTFEFHKGMVTSVEELSSVDQLFTSLVNGSLLPSALVWVTSRPAAANQIPHEYVGLFTEVRGFTDQQKEEYFRRNIKDETQASRIISHIKKSRSLYIMCYIPVFCWIIATVLQHLFTGNNAENIDTTLTEMYIHFVLIQMDMKIQKCDGKTERERTTLLKSNKTMILNLAKLAFEQLKKENIVFYKEDLEACDINDFESTGMLTEIFQQEAGLYEIKVFCFVHLSVQEFLAAVYVFFCYLNNNMKELTFFFEEPQHIVRRKIKCFLECKLHKTHRNKLHELLKNAVDKAMQSQKGHLDLFLRFLLGISLETNQKLLRGLFPNTEDSKYSATEVTQHITEQLKNKDISPDTSINMFYCLLELKDNSLNTEIQRYFRSSPERSLSSSMCSLLAYTLMMSEEVLDEFNLNMYKASSYTSLLPAVRCCRKANLYSCELNDTCCETVALALQIPNSPLIELDISHNDLQDSGVKLLSEGLKNANCQLKTLRLAGCTLTGQCCEYVASALQSSNSHLIELDMSDNDLQDSGVKLLSDGLKSPNCQLEILRLTGCTLTDQCCEFVASVLQSSNSRLIELDMNRNELQDSGVKLISDGLKSPNCQLKTLRLAGCTLTGQCCEYVASVLQSSNSSLIELDMNGNDLQDSGVKLLSDGLKSPNCQLEILRLSICRVTDEGCGYLASALLLNPSHLRELDLSFNNLGDSGVKMLSDLLKDQNSALNKLDIEQ